MDQYAFEVKNGTYCQVGSLLWGRELKRELRLNIPTLSSLHFGRT